MRLCTLDDQNKHGTVRVENLTIVPAGTESIVFIVTSNCGLMTIELIQTAKSTKEYSLGEVCMRSAQNSHSNLGDELHDEAHCTP